MKDFSHSEHQKSRGGHRGLVGLFFIAIGIVLLLGTLDILPYEISSVLFTWPMILVAFGLFNLLKKEFTSAIILLSIGGFFIIPDLFPFVDFRDVFKFWPLLLVLIGVSIYFKRKPLLPHNHITSNSDEIIDEVNVFGGGVSQIESNNFKGGKITAVFGGSEINLERCQLSDEGAVLEMVTIFGGAKLIVPRGWNVKTEVVSIFGGFADKRTYYNETVSDPSKTLYIKGVAIFGGGELRNF
ncbi:LiaF transmembrane domain-containing protein [Carboxylicivirga caseinilyticus]|uniref:LiaF transmembrane domain-containing protein n=1 Tax=Carboxylicivirga caseinilyticus TaxID=3417572 RepID=UPI003D348084|nr:hypothetical protein [Marinilabiliaceae bacterium A049]